MIKQQQQYPSTHQTNLPSTSHPPQSQSHNFKQRINQLKAKIKPRLSTVSVLTNQNTHTQEYITEKGKFMTQIQNQSDKIQQSRSDENQQPLPQIKTLSQHIKQQKQVVKIPERVVSQKKVIQMKVSYRKMGLLFKNIVIPKQPVQLCGEDGVGSRRMSSDCQVMGREELFCGGNGIQGYSTVNIKNNKPDNDSETSSLTNTDNNKNMRIQLNLNLNKNTHININKQQNKQNNPSNRTKQKSCEIQDILFNGKGYKSPIKSERVKLQTEYKFYERKFGDVEKDNDKREREKDDNQDKGKDRDRDNYRSLNPNENNQPNKPQKQKQKQKKSLPSYNLNININVRQCNSRTTRYSDSYLGIKNPSTGTSTGAVSGRNKKSLDKSSSGRYNAHHHVKGGSFCYKIK